MAQRDERTTEQFEHIIDPSTGIPVENDLASVTVVTADAAAADALSTAFYVRGEDFAADYCRDHPDVGAIFIKCGEYGTKLETTTAGTRTDLSSRPGGEL